MLSKFSRCTTCVFSSSFTRIADSFIRAFVNGFVRFTDFCSPPSSGPRGARTWGGRSFSELAGRYSSCCFSCCSVFSRNEITLSRFLKPVKSTSPPASFFLLESFMLTFRLRSEPSALSIFEFSMALRIRSGSLSRCA